MAIQEGVAPHRAYVQGVGAGFLLASGSVEQTAKSKSSTFSGTLPLGTPGAEASFANLGDNQVSIIVEGVGGGGNLVTGEIDGVDFDYIGGMISFTGRCQSAKLHEKKTSDKWINKTHAEIIQDLAGRVGLGADIDQSVALKAGRFIQDDWTALSDGIAYSTVIHKAAEFMGARWWVKDGTLHVKPADGSGGGAYTINYAPGAPKRADVLALKIHRDVQFGKPIKVTTKSFHPGKKEKYTGTYTVGGNGSTKEYSYHLPAHTQDHADQHAKAAAKDHARHELSLSATLIGDPSIDVAMKLSLRGTTFAQDYDIDSIRHSFGMGGYTMAITAKSAKQGRG